MTTTARSRSSRRAWPSCARAPIGEHCALALQQRIAVAEARFRESLELAGHSGDREDIAWSLLGLSAVELESGNGRRGALLLGAARRVLSEMSAALKPFERQLDQRTEERSRALNGDDEHQAAVGRGLALCVDEALNLVVDRLTLRTRERCRRSRRLR